MINGITARMGKRGIWWVGVLLVFLSFPARAGSPSVSGEDAYQEGLYLQYTRGDMDGALDSYGRALLGSGPGEHADRVILSQMECLDWTGQDHQSRAVIEQLQSESSVVAKALAGARFFPSEMQVVMRMDFDRLGAIRVMQDADLDFECGEGKIKFNDLLSDSGLSSLDGLRAIAAGLTLSGDDKYPVDHWIARLEYDENLSGSVAWADVVGSLLSRMCSKKSNGDVSPIVFSRTMRRVHGREMVVFTTDVHGGFPVGLDIALVDLHKGVLLLGDRRAVTDTLSAVDLETPGLRANQKMWTLASRLPADTAFWILVSPEEISSRLRSMRAVLAWAGAVPDIAGIMLYGKWEGDLSVYARAWTSDSQSAESLSDLLKGSVALLRMSSFAVDEKDKRVGKILGRLQMVTKADSIKISTSIPAGLLLDHD